MPTNLGSLLPADDRHARLSNKSNGLVARVIFDRLMVPLSMTKKAAGVPVTLSLDPRSAATLQRQLYDGLRAAILAGRLRPGLRLPSTRSLADDLAVSRNTVAAAFGLGFAGIIPAYVLAIRELFPAAQAYWRIPTFLLCSGTGMALGGWMSGAIFDLTGSYKAAFVNGLAWNLLNLSIAAWLLLRARRILNRQRRRWRCLHGRRARP